MLSAGKSQHLAIEELLPAGMFTGHLRDTHLHGSQGKALPRPAPVCLTWYSNSRRSFWGPQWRQHGAPVKMGSGCLRAVSGKHCVTFCGTHL